MPTDKLYVVKIRVNTYGRWNPCYKPLEGKVFNYFHIFDNKENFEERKHDDTFEDEIDRIIMDFVDDKNYEYEIEPKTGTR